MATTNDLKQMDYFPIRILSEKTGVNSVTLRAWERRYGLLKPYRTEKGHRLYQATDIERVRKVLYWVQLGVPVGKVRAVLSSESVSEVEELKQSDDGWLIWQHEFIELVLAMKYQQWESKLRETSKQYPIQVFLKKGLLPVLGQLRELPNELCARLALQSYLTDLAASMTVSFKGSIPSEQPLIIINLDNCALISRLYCWSKLDSKERYICIDGVRTIADVDALYREMSPRLVVVMAQDIGQAEAARWLQSWPSYNVNSYFVGASFWLANRATQMVEEDKHLFADLQAFLD